MIKCKTSQNRLNNLNSRVIKYINDDYKFNFPRARQNKQYEKYKHENNSLLDKDILSLFLIGS